MKHPVKEELLILTKTYPSPSTQYRETTCVAAINRVGELRRLFPVPYRLLDGDARFKKWEWIHAGVAHTDKDRRPESRRIDADSIERHGDIIETKHGDWSERLKWIEPHVVKSFAELEARRQATGETLGFLRPKRLVKLEITQVKDSEWTEADKVKLSQDGLFDSEEIKRRALLRKLPFDFHYHYESGDKVERHKLVDWEVGALYWNCLQAYGPTGWEAKFRKRLEIEFSQKDILLLMGTIHRFPDQWLIVGFVYPPRQLSVRDEQLGLQLGP
ncbi:MAG TPA: hypothetical protein VK811_06875 [Candidatus Acidoferrum sp.]|jgi:hypothetical protein|nr:hypothetical protein [Candidatus Acidoferrum sp.]